MSLFAGILPAGTKKGGATKLFSAHNKFRRGDNPASATLVHNISDVGKATGMDASGSPTGITESQPSTSKKQKNSREQPATERPSKKQKRQAGQKDGLATDEPSGISPAGEEKPRKKVKKKVVYAVESAEEHSQLAEHVEAPIEQPEVLATEKKAKRKKKAKVEELADDLAQRKRAETYAEPNGEVDTKRNTMLPAGEEGKKPKKARKVKPAADGEAELEQILASEGLGMEVAPEEQPAAQNAPAAQDADADDPEEPAQV